MDKIEKTIRTVFLYILFIIPLIALIPFGAFFVWIALGFKHTKSYVSFWVTFPYKSVFNKQ